MSDNRLFAYLALGCLFNAGYLTFFVKSVNILLAGKTDIDTVITAVTGIILVPLGGILGILTWF
jgi:hypothetical protein